MAATETRITFGVQYSDEPHPTFPACHPAGWVTIEADEDTARQAAFQLFGRAWSFPRSVADMPAEEWRRWFPLGELWRVDDTTARVLAAAFRLSREVDL